MPEGKSKILTSYINLNEFKVLFINSRYPQSVQGVPSFFSCIFSKLQESQCWRGVGATGISGPFSVVPGQVCILGSFSFLVQVDDDHVPTVFTARPLGSAGLSV